MLVGAFGAAQYQCSAGRKDKPFNPLLGETFEILAPTFKFFSEQVSHHPPISACHAQSDDYEFYGNSNLKTAFKGSYMTVEALSF